MPETPPSGLQRRLRGRQLTMIGIGGAIGTGLFLGSSLAISHAGPGVIVAYVVCGLIALVIAWALAEMVVVHPTAGAFGSIAHRYLGPGTGFVVRWAYWAMQVIAIGGETIAAGLYIQYWWPQIPLWVPVAIFGCSRWNAARGMPGPGCRPTSSPTRAASWRSGSTARCWLPTTAIRPGSSPPIGPVPCRRSGSSAWRCCD